MVSKEALESGKDLILVTALPAGETGCIGMGHLLVVTQCGL